MFQEAPQEQKPPYVFVPLLCWKQGCAQDAREASVHSVSNPGPAPVFGTVPGQGRGLSPVWVLLEETSWG